jgi:hypothetical protein
MDPCVTKVKRVKTGTGTSPESISFKCLSCLALLGFKARSKTRSKKLLVSIASASGHRCRLG